MISMGRLLILIICLSDLMAGQVTPNEKRNGPARRVSQLGSQTLAGDQVRELLTRQPSLASFEYRVNCGVCCATTEDLYIPERISVRKTPEETLRTFFRSEPRISIIKDAGGILRIKDSSLPPAVTDVKINSLTLDNIQDPDDAIHVILTLPEVQRFMSAQHLQILPMISSKIRSPRGADSPHLTITMHNVTVRQVMDRLIEMFPGLWIYYQCATPEGEGRFALLFNSLPLNNQSKAVPKP